jgi:hypothetical protein
MFTKPDTAHKHTPTKADRGLSHQLRLVDVLRARRNRADEEVDTPSISSESVRELVGEEQTSPREALPTVDGHGNSPYPTSQQKIEDLDTSCSPQE